MLIKRIVTGIIGMVLTVFVVNFGGWLFGSVCLALALTAWYELCKAFQHMGTKLWRGIGFFAIAFVVGCVWIGNMQETFAVLTATVLVILAKSVLAHEKFSVQEACVSVCGIFYIALAFSHLLLLRFLTTPEVVKTSLGELSMGCAFLWVAFIGTWASDTFAFFVGSQFGRRKLCPKISPGKTKEGFVGALVGTALCTAVLGALFSFPLFPMAVLGIFIAVAATIGDLVESSFKRLTGVKDSGQLLPGHGGVLDRFDSLMFTVPLVYYYVQIFVL